MKKPRVGSIVLVYDTPGGKPQAAIVTGVYSDENWMSVTVFEDREHKNGRAMVTRHRLLRATPGFASFWTWPPDEEEA